MKVSILGAGDITKIHRFSGTSENELKEIIRELAKFLAEKRIELVIVPARGIPYELAKIYKEFKGKKVIGLIPEDDKRYGIMHIKEYLEIADEKVNIGDWYNLNGEIAAYSDIAICIGLSGGAICDIAMLKYHLKYLKSKTKLLVFKNTLSTRLPIEIEEDIPTLQYVETVDEVKKFIESLKQ